MAPRVVVTGLGAISPCGHDVESNWASMVHGRSGIGLITRFDTTGWSTRIAGEVRDFDPDQVFGRRQARRMDRFAQFALVAARQAMADAGLAPGSARPERLGVYVGSGIGGLEEIHRGSLSFADQGPRGISPFFIPRSLVNLAGGQIAMEFLARGPSLAVASACASGNQSIGEAWRVIRMGEADIIIAGGAEAPIVPIGVAGFMSAKALSKRNDDPTHASRPFDKDRDGFVISEGAGILVLESLESATRRGAHIYGEVVGYGMSNDAYHLTAPLPHGEGAATAMRLALASARLRPCDVDYINAHGTATQANDITETLAIKAVFEDYAPRLPVSSTKSVTGHLMGAAGGIEAVACLMAIVHGIIPPTATLESPDEQCDLDYVPGLAREAKLAVVMSNAFGFGGINTAVIFQCYEE